MQKQTLNPNEQILLSFIALQNEQHAHQKRHRIVPRKSSTYAINVCQLINALMQTVIHAVNGYLQTAVSSINMAELPLSTVDLKIQSELMLLEKSRFFRSWMAISEQTMKDSNRLNADSCCGSRQYSQVMSKCCHFAHCSNENDEFTPFLMRNYSSVTITSQKECASVFQGIKYLRLKSQFPPHLMISLIETNVLVHY